MFDGKLLSDFRLSTFLIWVHNIELMQATNDKEQVEPMRAQITVLPEGLNQPGQLLADTEFLSEHNVQCCQGARNRAADCCRA